MWRNSRRLARPRPHTLEKYCGILVQYPTTDGRIVDYGPLTEAAHQHNTQIIAATDLLALTLIKPPGEWAGGGADIAVGSAQRFGVPMGFGGPHAAFMACKSEFTRKLPGRIVGVSKDTHGNPAYRLALQTREQHIRREKATSNICTAQVLLAIMASMYAVYHGPEGLKAIARRVHTLASKFAANVAGLNGLELHDDPFFDTVLVYVTDRDRAAEIAQTALKFGYNLRDMAGGSLSVSFDETSTIDDVDALSKLFTSSFEKLAAAKTFDPSSFKFDSSFVIRHSSFLQHPVFNSFHSEHEILRYINRLQAKDLSLTTSMIPLGSCTMKLNATSEMIPVTWPEFGKIHPFAPADQTAGYQQLFTELETSLAEITGFHAVSLQPNAGSQGEYAGLLAIRAYHEAQAKRKRTPLSPQPSVLSLPPSATSASSPPPPTAPIPPPPSSRGCMSSRFPATPRATSTSKTSGKKPPPTPKNFPAS